MMNLAKQRVAVFLLWTLWGFGAAEGDNTVCAHGDDLPITDGVTRSMSSELLGGEVMDDNRTIRCSSNIYCFTLWVSDARNRSRVSILKQGCWIGEPDQCMSGTCVSNIEPKNNSHFCCCSGDLCNVNFTDSYNPAQHTTTAFLPSEPRPLHDNSYKIKTIVISLVSVFSVALVIIVTYFGYRMCMRPKQPSVESLQVVKSPPSPPEFDMDELKLCNIISKGRYAEVWKGKLEEEDVAVKIYSPHYRDYYNNERSLYRLPFMEHNALVRFFGADERITPDGTPQLMIIMSYVPNGSLSSYLKNNLLDWPTMVTMAHSVAKGVSHLHTDIQKGEQFKPVLAHRDINTRNILVRNDLTCVVADLGFGVATMGSKLIKKGHAEVAEQTSLTDVGTLRYMAPELLDGAVNLRDCEASLKQIDMYAVGLVLWEISMRCVDLYQGAPVPEYKPPFHAEVGANPTFEEMQMIVVRAKRRPKFPEVWKETNQAVRSLRETIEECWDADAEARLTALCVEERMAELPNLWALEWKHRGMTPTLNAMININETSSTVDKPHVADTDNQGRTESLHTAAATTDLPPSYTAYMQDHEDTAAPLLGNGHVPSGEASVSSASVSQHHWSWLHEHSVSASTVDTILLPTPGDNPNLPPKTSNLVQERNSTVTRPQQGRNPTVERNTHKRSDEELRVSGNTLVSNLRRDSLSTQSAPPDHPASESPPEFVGDGLETSLVQNDALSHRNPPIPYLQNQVHGSTPAGRPKVANTAPLRAYNRGDRSLREKLSRLIWPKELSLKLSSFSLFGGGRRHDYSRADDLEVDDLQQEQNTVDGQAQNTRPGSHHGSAVTQPGTCSVQTEVCLQNGSAVTRPANLSLRNTCTTDSRTRTDAPKGATNLSKETTHTTRQSAGIQNSASRSDHQPNMNGSSVQYPENRLRFAEVGVAKLHMPTVFKQPVRRLQGSGHSKSTSELLQLSKNHNSCWQETELSTSSDSTGKRRRPNSLSLKGHNYCLLFKPPPPLKSTSKPDVHRETVLSRHQKAAPASAPAHEAKDSFKKKHEAASHKDCSAEGEGPVPGRAVPNMELKPHDEMSDPSEKIRRRVKTPIRPSKKNARLSLYDDRLMSSGLDGAVKGEAGHTSLKKSSTITKLATNNNSIVLGATDRERPTQALAAREKFQCSRAEVDASVEGRELHLLV